MSRALALLLRLGAALALAGCGAAEPPPKEPPKTAPPKTSIETTPPDLATGSWGEYRSERFDLRLPLPDATMWRVEDERSPWLEATHDGAAAKLLVRAWREAGIVDRARCEAQARLWRDLPELERAEIVDLRRINVPPGFDTVAHVGIVAPRGRRGAEPLANRGGGGDGGEPITGFVMAFGGWAHRCFAYVLTTTASGKGAERLIAVRLASMVELSLLNVKVEREVAPDVPREPPP